VIDAEAKAECQRNVDASRILLPRKISSATFAKCKALADPVDGDRCAATAARITAIRAKRPDLCARIPDRMAHVRADCEGYFAGHREPRDYAHMPINQAKQRNILLHGKGGGRFESVSKAWNAHDTAWSWTGKFGDLDNDGWQDVYVVNGRWGWGNSLVPNVFLRNVGGRRFELAQDEYGLSDYPVVSGYTYVDLDNDGDLDIVTNAVAAPHRVYVNGAGAAGRSLTVELRDHRGNRMGIGSKVVVRGADGSTRFREVKAGGGFMSFDAPVLHFGLGSLEEVASVEVIWSTGERTVIDAALATGQHLLIERRLEAAPELAAQGGR